MAAQPPPKTASLDLQPHGLDVRPVTPTRREVVTVALKKEDYERLKAVVGPHPDQIHTALKYYVDLIRETGWRPQESSFGWNRGPVVHFPCAIPKDLAEDIRNLPGRFDGHTIEAVQLLFNGEALTAQKIPQEFRPGPTLGSTLLSGTVGVLGLVVSRIFGQPPFP